MDYEAGSYDIAVIGIRRGGRADHGDGVRGRLHDRLPIPYRRRQPLAAGRRDRGNLTGLG